ncbi:cathepsin O-like [Haliotis rufescens]|uniref:cathepsin O-like n=1 Tax=Haliotis rufescens TaxID=6454 RepID=UPI00201FA2EB|nr:cathepsin O-like [Haliotis rufescens]
MDAKLQFLLPAWLICTVTFALHDTHYGQFTQFIQTYKKTYEENSPEFWHRFEVFKNNLKHYTHLNKAHQNETVVYGVNKFSDLMQEEFEKQYLRGLKSSSLHGDRITVDMAMPSLKLLKTAVPDYVDWRNKSIISAIKDQKSCGACWAFSATETVESMYAKTTGQAVPDLSVQEVIDCSENNGCKGGDTCSALYWMTKYKKTIVYEKDYPLVDKTQVCHLGNSTSPGVRVANYTCQHLTGKEEEMVQMLYAVGPLTVTVDASTWNNYIGGIIKFHCSNVNNHAVQIVGYDRRGDVPFYIVRNSWGTDFGDNGYLYIKIGDNLCGVAERVSTVTVQP